MAAAAPKTRSILIVRSNGQQIVEGIPANAKITFGPVNPGKPGYNDSNCLRIYTTGNNQLAVFTNVQFFRDLSLTVKTMKKQEKQNRQAEHGPAGSKVSTETEEKYEWVDEGEEFSQSHQQQYAAMNLMPVAVPQAF